MAKRSIAKGCGAALGCVAALIGGGVVALVALVWIGGGVLNAGAINPADVDATWFVRGPGYKPIGDGAAALRTYAAIQNDCRPMTNGVRIAFNHLWYNALTSNYDTQFWLKKERGRSFGMYVWGNNAFLRNDYRSRSHRLLVCSLDSEGWLKLGTGGNPPKR